MKKWLVFSFVIFSLAVAAVVIGWKIGQSRSQSLLKPSRGIESRPEVAGSNVENKKIASRLYFYRDEKLSSRSAVIRLQDVGVPISAFALRIHVDSSSDQKKSNLSKGNFAVTPNKALENSGWNYALNQVNALPDKSLNLDLALVNLTTTGFNFSQDLDIAEISWQNLPSKSPITLTFDSTQTKLLTKQDKPVNLALDTLRFVAD